VSPGGARDRVRPGVLTRDGRSRGGSVASSEQWSRRPGSFANLPGHVS
jgi:hypothetical protein